MCVLCCPVSRRLWENEENSSTTPSLTSCGKPVLVCLRAEVQKQTKALQSQRTRINTDP